MSMPALSATWSRTPLPPSVIPALNASCSVCFNISNLLVFTTLIENSTMKSTNMRVSTSA